MLQEAEREFAKDRLLAYAVWTTVGGEGGSKAADNAIKALDFLAESYFPFRKGATSPERDKQELAILDKVMRSFGMGDVVDSRKGKPIQVKGEEPKGRQSIWEKMLNFGKKDK